MRQPSMGFCRAAGLLTILVGLVTPCLWSASAPVTDPADMALAQARAARDQEEAALGKERSLILAGRIALDRRIAQAEATLRRRRRQARDLDHSQAILAEDLARAQAQEKLDQATVQRLLGTLADAAGIPDADRPGLAALSVADLGRRIAAGITHRIDDLARAPVWQPRPITGRDGRTYPAKVIVLGPAQTWAIDPSGQASGLVDHVRPGIALVVGPVPGAEAADLLRRWSMGTADHAPFAPAGLATPAMEASPRGLAAWMRAGGFFMWPILAVAIAGAVLILERIWYLWRSRTPPALLLAAEDVIAGRRAAPSPEPMAPMVPMGRLLAAGAVDGAGAGRTAAIERALFDESPGLERGLSLIAVLAGVAPLLGLLGTVTGMIGMFATISGHGSGNPKLLSGHISVALVTTQFGLLVAVPLLLAHAVLARCIERREGALERVANGLLDDQPPKGPESPGTAP